MKNISVKWLLLAFALALGIDMGGGIFETVVIVPVWSASAEIARNWNANPQTAVEGGKFFIVATNLTALLALLTLIFGWKSPPPLRFWLRLGAGGFLVLFIFTMAYFVPEQLSIKGARATQNLSDAEILWRAGRWVMLNYLRVLAAFVLLFATLKAVSLSSVLEGKDA